MNYTLMVYEFMKKHKQFIGDHPKLVPMELARFRLDLIKEELEELEVAIEMADIYLIADALADLKYVIFGMEITYGITVNDTVFEMVHLSNMTKDPSSTDGRKVQKGKNYVPPRIRPIIDAAIRLREARKNPTSSTPSEGE